MRANRTFELIVSREHLGPAFLADGERRDRVELVSIEDGETALFWVLPAREAARLLRVLRRDLATLEADELLARWSERDGVA